MSVMREGLRRHVTQGFPPSDEEGESAFSETPQSS
jgi:hypothetical protein